MTGAETFFMAAIIYSARSATEDRADFYCWVCMLIAMLFWMMEQTP